MGKKTEAQKRSTKRRKVYRQFARIKYTKYRNQFPRLKEAELVNKILQEWENLDEESKQNLAKQCEGEGFLKISSSSTPKSSDKDKDKAAKDESSSDKHIKKVGKAQRKVKSVSKVQSMQEKSSKKSGKQLKRQRSSSDLKGSDKGKKKTPSKQSSSSDKRLYKLGQNIKPATRSDYMNFQKYYSQKLGSEHPRWTREQISTIVKLLWRKRQKSGSKTRKRETKPLSGRQIYSRVKHGQGFMGKQIRKMWGTLPHQSKVYWELRGGKKKIHKSNRATSKNLKRILNSGADSHKKSESEASAAFQWMTTQIK